MFFVIISGVSLDCNWSTVLLKIQGHLGNRSSWPPDLTKFPLAIFWSRNLFSWSVGKIGKL